MNQRRSSSHARADIDVSDPGCDMETRIILDIMPFTSCTSACISTNSNQHNVKDKNKKDLFSFFITTIPRNDTIRASTSFIQLYTSHFHKISDFGITGSDFNIEPSILTVEFVL